jgi:arginase
MLVIGVPQFLGERLESRTEIQEILETGFLDKIGERYIEIEPDYDAYDDPVIATNAALASIIVDHADEFPVILASDCTSCLGAVKGLTAHHDELGVVWYDAHGDFNTPDTSPSGFLGGMPLAALVGRGNEHLLEGLELEPIPEDHVMITDVRDLDPVEGDNLQASNVIVYEDVADLLDAPLPDYPLYIHLDVDILDPQYMPALGYPADNGPTPEAVIETLARLARDGKIAGLLVSLWNADRANNDLPRDNTLRMVHGLLNNL